MAQELKKAHYCKLFEVCDFSALVCVCMWIWGRGIWIEDKEMIAIAEKVQTPLQTVVFVFFFFKCKLRCTNPF